MAASAANKIADLHCDLLEFLANHSAEIDNPDSRCSRAQLRAGNVFLQVLAIYTQTNDEATLSFQKQARCYSNLETLYSDDFVQLKELKMPTSSERIHLLPAIENASGLCGEKDPLESCFRNLDEFRELAGPVLYISLTWNDENRFGGGNLSKVGLKRDGELLLQYMDKSGIAIDLSHTSDALAADILSYIDKKSLAIRPIASHSNFRAVVDEPRNLTDEAAEEIVKRGGIIGLNLVRRFVGKIEEQVRYAMEKGFFDHHCFGADFFSESSVPSLSSLLPFFYKEYQDASCYPELLNHLNLEKKQQEQLCYGNLEAFFARQIGGVNAHSR